MNAAKFLTLLVSLFLSLTTQARVFRCEGQVEFRPGQVQPLKVQLIEAEDEVWFVEVHDQLVEVGRDSALDSGSIKLNNYFGRGRNFVRADYDIVKKELYLAYNLGAQIFDGGLFKNCREIDITPRQSCGRGLSRKWAWWEGL